MMKVGDIFKVVEGSSRNFVLAGIVHIEKYR